MSVMSDRTHSPEAGSEGWRSGANHDRMMAWAWTVIRAVDQFCEACFVVGVPHHERDAQELASPSGIGGPVANSP